MTTTEIEQAVIDGKKVHWKNTLYTVVKHDKDFFIGCNTNGRNPNYVRLCWNQYNPRDFFIAK